VKVSVIMPVDRGDDARRAIDSILAQEGAVDLELLVVARVAIESVDRRLRSVIVADRNPAVRRNAAAAIAGGEVLAFIDDDATASPDWLMRGLAILAASSEAVAVGGPDPAPSDSTTAELISETLLATPLIGSGIACHENRRGSFQVRHPTDLALVNLFVRREAFERVGGFDPAIGYIGEDTALIERLLTIGRVVYDGGVVVHHRRRAFPGPYLAQRWRYRLKTGALLAGGSAAYSRNPKLLAFLAAALLFLLCALLAPPIALAMLALYAAATLILSVPATRLPMRWWPLLPFAFALHHATYLAGIVVGSVKELLRRQAL
jgi:glycosyltransferase involved in cell wall biosynthesis